MDEHITQLAEQLGQCLSAQGRTISTAESCTGGWVAKAITDIAGSSQWFDRGFVTYSDQAKIELLDVRADTLEQHGAVCAATVSEMAQGALTRSGADCSVAISGIAGPDGGSAERPVGTVWLAWCQRGADPKCVLQHYRGDREAVRRQAVVEALQGLLRICESG